MKLWRPRFSLRTLLIVMALVAGAAAWFSSTALRQRRAVAELRKLSADVLYEYRADPRSTPWYPDRLRQWLGIDFFAQATEVQFGFDDDWVSQNASSGINRSQVVLSERSQSLRAFMDAMERKKTPQTGGRPLVMPAPPRQTIDAGTMLQLRRLPHLRKLTINATTGPKRGGGTWQPINDANDNLILDVKSLQLLRDASSLEELEVRLTTADDELLAALKGFTHLQRLSVGPANISEQGLRHLESLTSLQQLEFAKFGKFRIGYPGVPSPPNIPAIMNLREVSVPKLVITNQTARRLPSLPNLELLECNSIDVDDEGLRLLTAALPQLRQLNLLDARITNAGCESLAKMSNLQGLILTNQRITDDGLKHLARLTKLDTLYAPILPITDDGLEHLRHATEMKVLMLAGTRITDAGVRHLSGMTELESLDLSFTAITDKSVDDLLALKKLQNIRVLGTGISGDGASRLRQAFPAAKIADP